MAIASSMNQPKRGRRHLSLVAGDQARCVGDPAFDTSYWLAHCEGYRVDSEQGRIGFVEEVRLGRSHPSDTVLAVRTGILGRRVLLVPATATAVVVPRAERIWLRTPVTITGTEPRRGMPGGD